MFTLTFQPINVGVSMRPFTPAAFLSRACYGAVLRMGMCAFTAPPRFSLSGGESTLNLLIAGFSCAADTIFLQLLVQVNRTFRFHAVSPRRGCAGGGAGARALRGGAEDLQPGGRRSGRSAPAAAVAALRAWAGPGAPEGVIGQILQNFREPEM